MLFKDLENYLEEHNDIDYELLKEEANEIRFWLEQMKIYIPEYSIIIREGICETWDVQSYQYEGDHTFYMFFDAQTGEYLYDESGSSMTVSLYNFLQSVKHQSLTEDELLNLQCEVK
ncbi:MAG: hypothetical protein K2G70_04435 [Turicibacter sp.]|nr:hypothetical protein [Turicibacter sp.]